MRGLGLLIVFVLTPFVTAAQCLPEKDADHLIVAPKLSTGWIDTEIKAITGTIPTPTNGATVLLCIERAGALLPDVGHPVSENGAFSIDLKNLHPNDKISVEVLTSTHVVGVPSKTITVAQKQIGEGNFKYNLIAGIEESSFSSLGLNTNPFIQAYIEGTTSLTGWGRVRILGAPEASTNGIGSSYIDPAGTITKLDFAKVGTSLDVVAGPALNVLHIPPGGSLSIIAGIGWTTPLSSQDVAYVFKVPDVGTLECQELRSRFSSATGFNPGLVADPTGKSCLVNGGTAVKDISFANQDRSNFLPKWGAGLRVAGTGPEGTVSMLDATIGQDAVITGGHARNFVAKFDGVLSLSRIDDLIYFYGSIYTRFSRNKDLTPLILAAETNKPTGPSADVVVLPFKQPDRDFFRLGIGVNLDKLAKAIIAGAKKGS